MTSPHSASAVGGKTARSCDGCARRRARWYCAADDAFLCQSCDSSVHSANPLARRHHRLRLNTSSSSGEPAWHQDIKRKPRTPRPHLQHPPKSSLVPELDTSADENSEESQLLYCVPIFDPFLSEFCSPPLLDEEAKPTADLPTTTAAVPAAATDDSDDGLVGFLPSEVELAEFAADMESLLGRGLGDDSFSMEELGLVGSSSSGAEAETESEKVKLEMVENGDIDMVLDNETLDLEFYCGSQAAATGEDDGEAAAEGPARRAMSLRLDYDALISEWSTQGSSPWTDGQRPEIGPDDYWLDHMGMLSGRGGGMGFGGGGDGGREARVTRYREKRRTRLFSKKIRYEVRKLNAEKRPRMKGRFVKRAASAAAAAAGASAYVY